MIRARNPRERSNPTSVKDKSPGTYVRPVVFVELPALGLDDVDPFGAPDGASVTFCSPKEVSLALGCAVLFIKEGLLVGRAVGSDVGLTVGLDVTGATVGALVGFKVGLLVGDRVGDGTTGARAAFEGFLFS